MHNPEHSHHSWDSLISNTVYNIPQMPQRWSPSAKQSNLISTFTRFKFLTWLATRACSVSRPEDTAHNLRNGKLSHRSGARNSTAFHRPEINQYSSGRQHTTYARSMKSRQDSQSNWMATQRTSWASRILKSLDRKQGSTKTEHDDLTQKCINPFLVPLIPLSHIRKSKNI